MLEGASVTVTVVGELDEELAGALRDAFSSHVLEAAEPVESVFIDLRGVLFADTAGLGGVAWCRRHAARAGVPCRVDLPIWRIGRR
ncbi:STAS domain-containing protein [Nocardioides sp. SYSU DS0663]|uniref:STAS domain-containing protein n=1 Tax=Nocardioides sp. SYSU DS0663 TaxID=3416445 RepID=UPI003F4C01C4